MGDEDFDLTAQLDKLSLDADVYTSYIDGIMEDEDMPLEERVESVLAFLGSATEESLDAFGEGLKAHWARRRASQQEAAAALDKEKAEGMRAYQARMEADKRAAEEEAQRQADEQLLKTRDRAEARGREAILNKYGFDTDAVDEEGNFVGTANGGGGAGDADAELSAMLGSNANKAAVEAAARAQREKAKAAHADKVARDKAALLQQKLKKEMEKKRTQKQERRAGRG